MIQFDDATLAAWLAGFLLPFFRALALMSTAPVLSNRAVPVRLRVALALVIVVVAAPSIEVPRLDLGSATGFGLVAREVAIGLTIGFIARLVFAGFELAGEAIGLQMGLSFAGFFDPSAGAANAVGRLLNTFALLAFVAIDGPLMVLAAVIHSFSLFPIVASPDRFTVDLQPLSAGADLFALGLTIALPFLALLLFINLTLGIVSRVAPQFNVFSVGFPVTIGAGLALLTMGLPLLEQPLLSAIQRMLTLLGVN